MDERLDNRGRLYAPPTVVNGMLYVPSWDHKLYAFSPVTDGARAAGTTGPGNAADRGASRRAS
jgi:hypothetical protein